MYAGKEKISEYTRGSPAPSTYRVMVKLTLDTVKILGTGQGSVCHVGGKSTRRNES